MTISSTETKAIYVGDGSTNTFPVPFMFLRNEDIRVLLVDEYGLELPRFEGIDYTLSGVGDQMGGTCVLFEPPATGRTVVIRREPALVQEVDYVENDAFPAATHEAALDKLTMICQALAEKLDRALTFRISSAVTGVNLPEPGPDLVLAWNAEGNDLVNKDVAGAGGLTVPVPISQGGTNADNPAEALFNLGFGAVGVTVAGCEEEAEVLAAIGAEPADADLLKADKPGLLRAAYGDDVQVHSGPDLSGLAVVRNHVAWTLTGASLFSDVSLPYDGTYVFHVYPGGNSLALAASYKSDGLLPSPSLNAGEIRIAVEQFNARKTIVSLQNVEV
ncbi:phage tail fiber protein [uncultured Pseudodesulfovibrio sp.]|uniref:phage tail fiber protein n=1 Tax=uncultured Pseudodesulfovibrio sp. TaxID=2035858 RepID=UPI0029C675F8|nr:phage tail fiber protein [uncultured Pseudodesulfovibrio sp.]